MNSYPTSPMPFVMGPLHNLLVFALVAILVIAALATTILGWIAVSQIRRSRGKLHGMWLAVFNGLLFPVLALVIFCFRLAVMPSAQAARIEAPARSSRVAFSFTHPEQLGGHKISMNVQDGSVSNWLPSSGQALSLKDGKYLAFRVRVDASTPGSLIAEVMSTTSRDPERWKTCETKQAALGAGKRVVPLDFANGLHVSAWLGDHLARPSEAEAASSADPTFGPVIERVVQDMEESHEGNALSLETGILLGMRSSQGRQATQLWLAKDAIDLMCESGDTFALYVNGITFGDVPDSSWETATPHFLEAACQAGTTRLELGNKTMGEWKSFRWNTTGALPATFAFRKVSGLMGIMQIIGPTENPPGVKIRYKLVPSASTDAMRKSKTPPSER